MDWGTIRRNVASGVAGGDGCGVMCAGSNKPQRGGKRLRLLEAAGTRLGRRLRDISEESGAGLGENGVMP